MNGSPTDPQLDFAKTYLLLSLLQNYQQMTLIT